MKSFREMIILIAEDDDGHAILINDGLKEVGVCNQIIRFSNGKEVLDFLTKKEQKEIKDNKAYLLLLDINMPIMNGIDVLRNMKGNEDLKDIPIIMLTTTDDPKEVEECYKIGCNFYITKPIDFMKFAETLNRLGLFIQIIKI